MPACGVSGCTQVSDLRQIHRAVEQYKIPPDSEGFVRATLTKVTPTTLAQWKPVTDDV